METAKGTDLPDLLEHLGYRVRRVGGRYHTTKEMDNYIGEVSKANCAVVTYTAIFGSEKAAEESKAPSGDEKNDDHTGDAEVPDSTEAPDTAKEPADLSSLKRPVMIGVVVLALGAGSVFAFKKYRERR